MEHCIISIQLFAYFLNIFISMSFIFTCKAGCDRSVNFLHLKCKKRIQRERETDRWEGVIELVRGGRIQFFLFIIFLRFLIFCYVMFIHENFPELSTTSKLHVTLFFPIFGVVTKEHSESFHKG